MPAYQWLSAQNGTWGAASFWNPNGIPGASGGDTALIDATGATYIVTFDETSRSINGLTINSLTATLSFNGNTSLTVFGTTSLTAGSLALLNSGATLAAGALTAASGTTIQIGAGASVTYNSGSFSGLVSLSGTTSFGSASASMTLNGTLEVTSGLGTIGFSGISGSGVIEADGAAVLVTGSMAGSSVHAVVTNSASSVFTNSGSLYYGASTFVDFLGAAGQYAYDNPASNTNINFNITGLNAGTSAVSPTNSIRMAGTVVTVTGGGSGSGSTGTIILSNGNQLILTGITSNGGLSTWLAQTVSDGSGGTNIFLQSVCYAAGTRILTPAGERAVEQVVAGDEVLVLSGDRLVPMPVRWVGSRRISLAAHPHPASVAPILIQRGAVADAVPHRDLYVSPAHAILVDDRLVCARQLVNGATIRQETGWTAVDYHHIELDRHAILLAEGLPAESYLDTGNRGFFADAGVPLVLHPDLTDPSGHPARAAMSCHRFVWAESDVAPLWQRLADRARARGHGLMQCATTADAAPTLIAGGRTLSPIDRGDGRCVFALPPATQRVRLCSRAGSPRATRPWLDDDRRLGLMVRRIRFHLGAGTADMPLDHPGLSHGWWDVERNGAAMARWTDGDATLDVPDGAVLLEITADPLPAYAIDPASDTAATIRRIAGSGPR